MSVPTYVFENGLRKVVPYFFTYKSRIKQRWVGKTLVEVLSKELGQQQNTIAEGINNNLIYIYENVGKNGEATKVEGWELLSNRKLQRHDLIYSTKHLHEPCVSDEQPLATTLPPPKFPSQVKTHIHIVYEDNEVIVVNKPSGIPTHPSGNYRYNTVTEILKHDLKTELWPCHRLDKVTSGILILGITKEGTKKYMKLIEQAQDQVHKTYIARVVGEFPAKKCKLRCPVFVLNASGKYISQPNADNLPTNSSTIFTRLSYDQQSNESIVMCQPLTGRMHQIRIHLRNLGHPIVNDFAYNSKWHESLPAMVLKNEIEMELYQRIFDKYPAFNQTDSEDTELDSHINVYEVSDFYGDYLQGKCSQLQNMGQEEVLKRRESYGKTCDQCQLQLFDNDVVPKYLSVWLHAIEYRLGEAKFTTNLPRWADVSKSRD